MSIDRPAISVNRPMVTVSTKSPGVAILLTILFGPIGMLYSTILGAIVMFIVSVLVALVTLGFGLILTWPICVLWAALAAVAYNRKIMRRYG